MVETFLNFNFVIIAVLDKNNFVWERKESRNSSPTPKRKLKNPSLISGHLSAKVSRARLCGFPPSLLVT